MSDRSQNCTATLCQKPPSSRRSRKSTECCAEESRSSHKNMCFDSTRATTLLWWAAHVEEAGLHVPLDNAANCQRRKTLRPNMIACYLDNTETIAQLRGHGLHIWRYLASGVLLHRDGGNWNPPRYSVHASLPALPQTYTTTVQAISCKWM